MPPGLDFTVLGPAVNEAGRIAAPPELFTADPTAVTRPTHSAPGVAGNGGFSR